MIKRPKYSPGAIFSQHLGPLFQLTKIRKWMRTDWTVAARQNGLNCLISFQVNPFDIKSYMMDPVVKKGTTKD